jgi:hypothetical protein
VFRPGGANLIAQEGGVSALLYKDRYRVCVFMWGSTVGELLLNLFMNYIVLLEDTFYIQKARFSGSIFFYICGRMNEIGCRFTRGVSGNAWD